MHRCLIEMVVLHIQLFPNTVYQACANIVLSHCIGDWGFK